VNRTRDVADGEVRIDHLTLNIPARHHEVDEKLGRPSLHRRYEDAGRDQEGEKNNRRAEA
jgi:hypothetical protein